MDMHLIAICVFLLGAHVARSCSMAINGESAGQYLGQFHYRYVSHSLIDESLSHQEKYIQVLKSAELYFRNWNDRRRLIIVRGDDDTIRRTSDEATDNYRCELAVRNINLGKYFTWKCGEEKSCEPRRCPNFSFTGFLQSDGDAVPIE